MKSSLTNSFAVVILLVLAMGCNGRSEMDWNSPVSNGVVVYDNGVTIITKVNVDSVDYLLVTRRGGGTAIIKHK